MSENNPAFENVKAIQFNGWNFGVIYDWVVKNEDGTFSVMSNYEFEEKLEK